MEALTIFGLFAVTAMLVFYALKDRSPWFILLFSLAFGLVESVWSVVALRRWWWTIQ